MAANDVHFQAYLLEGIVRWNADREEAAARRSTDDSRSFSDQLKAATCQLTRKVLGQSRVDFQPAKAYTGKPCFITRHYDITHWLKYCFKMYIARSQQSIYKLCTAWSIRNAISFILGVICGLFDCYTSLCLHSYLQFFFRSLPATSVFL